MVSHDVALGDRYITILNGSYNGHSKFSPKYCRSHAFQVPAWSLTFEFMISSWISTHVFGRYHDI